MSAVPALRRRDKTGDPTLPVILEFQWPSTAIVNAPVPPVARNTTWIVFTMVAALIVAMAVIPVDQVVTAAGIVVSKLPTIQVQPLETAIVRSIEVKEGQRVHAGDLLARLDPTFAAADEGAVGAQVESLTAEEARLEAEAAGNPFAYSGSDASMQLQAAIYGHRKAEFDARVANYEHKMKELSVDIERSRADADAYRDRLDVARRIERMRATLQKADIGSELLLLGARDSRAEMERSLANAERTADSAQAQLDALKSERDSYVQGWKAEVGQKLSQTQSQLSDAAEQLNKAKLRRKLVELRAQRDGIVQTIAHGAPGSVVASGTELITLVPTDGQLEVESNVLGRDHGFIRVGDPVAIKFETFPFAQYGMAQGVVRTISADAFTAQEEQHNPTSKLPVAPNSSEPFYRARITIDAVKLHNVPEGFHVEPGMPVVCDIKTGKRTVLTYLLGRVLPVVKEGMQEPN
jgi:hemolysin D